MAAARSTTNLVLLAQRINPAAISSVILKTGSKRLQTLAVVNQRSSTEAERSSSFNNERNGLASDTSSSSSSDEEGASSSENGSPPGVFKNEYYTPTTIFQKSLLALGSGLSSFFDPTRAESIATFGEVTAELRLGAIHQSMLQDPEGARILEDKPRINSKSIDLDYLATLPEGTFGWAYIEFLKKNNVTPDSRLPVRFIEDPELAYVMQRYREVHDLIHTVTGMPTNMLGEVVVKWIEGIQTGLPMCVTGGLFGATRLKPKQRAQYVNTHLPWAIRVGLNSKPLLLIYYEQRWENSLYELRNHICPLLNSPPK